jgi:hypothetical protein
LDADFEKTDANSDGLLDEWDYAAWWGGLMETYPEDFSRSVWESLNPGMLWSTYFD